MERDYDLTERRIINYLRKVNNKDSHNTRCKIIGLFYETIDANIPINRKIEDYKSLLEDYPDYFHAKSREEIIELYNKEVAFKKEIKYPFVLSDYDIKEDSYLEISTKTFRPIYNENWREKTEAINGTPVKNQQSFYNEYLKYYLQFKEFPTYLQFIKHLFYKYQRPLHKDIKTVFDNIEKSYLPIKKFIKTNNLSFKEVKRTIVQSASIPLRIKLEQEQS